MAKAAAKSKQRPRHDPPFDPPFGAPLDENEAWKAIPGFIGYEASSYGRIRSLDRTLFVEGPARSFKRRHRGTILKPSLAGSRRNYLYVGLGKLGKRGVHVLVALAFHGLPPSPDHEVAHWNGHPSDNAPGNVRWATALENSNDMERHGTRVVAPKPKGENHHKAKLTEDQVRLIRATRASNRELASRFGVNESTIGSARNGETWSHVV